MVVNQPHFLLFCDTNLSSTKACAVGDQGFGRWHFVLERLDGPERLEVADAEASVHRDRLALLAVVRGLEALEQPSHVTLVTTSRYVSRGLRYGLNEWREAEYTWEHFGSQRPIRNADLWQRVDRALGFHQITCRLLQSQLAQAMVETVAEIDELSLLSRPLDLVTPSDAAESAAVHVVREHSVKDAPTLAPLLGNHESANRSIRAKSGKIQRVDEPHLPRAFESQSAAVVEPRLLSRTENKRAERAIAAPRTISVALLNNGVWRPKIRLSIPVFHFHQRIWQRVLGWLRWLRMRTTRAASAPVMAPT